MTGVNTSLTLTGTDAVSEVLTLKPCSVVLEPLPMEYLEKSSWFLQSSVDHSRKDDDPYEAESDSGDSLFQTQKPVPKAVRSKRRYRSIYNSDLTSASGSDGSDESENEPSAPASQGKYKRCKRSWKRVPLPKFSFPFLSRIQDDKHQPRRRRRRSWNQDHLTSRKNTELHNFAMGGFFKCVREMQEGNVKAPTAFLDEDGDISPLSEGENDGSDLEDIKVVKKTAFVVSCKRPQPWYTPSTGDIIVNQEKHVVRREEETELSASCEAVNDDREKRENKKGRVREDEDDIERSPSTDAGGGSLNDEDVAIKMKKKKGKSLEVTEEPSTLSLDSPQNQSTGSCEELMTPRKKCKKRKKNLSCGDAAEAVEEKEDEDVKHCDNDVAVCGQAVKKKKKKKKEGEKSICQTSEDVATAAQSDDSVSVQETEKKRATSVCAADAVEKETQTQTRQEKTESVYAPSGEKGVHACDFEANSAEREANGKVKDKKRKSKQKREERGKRKNMSWSQRWLMAKTRRFLLLKKKKKSKQAPVSVMQEAESQTSKSTVTQERNSKESSASLLTVCTETCHGSDNTDEMVSTSERASSSSTDPTSIDKKVKKRAGDVSPEETDAVRPEKSKKIKIGSHSPSQMDTLSSSDKVKKDKGQKGKKRLYNPSDAFMDI